MSALPSRRSLALLAPVLGGVLLGCPPEAMRPVPDDPDNPRRRHRIRLEPQTVVTSPIPGDDCALPPSWLHLKPCAEDGYAYARAEAPIGINPSLSRDQAGQRARWALAEALGRIEDGHARLVGAELPELYLCEGTAYALARLRTKRHRLPGCGTTLRSRAIPPEDCPEWTRGVAWHEDDALIGISQIDGVRNPVVARNSALRRARLAASEMIEIQLTERDGAVTSFTETQLLTTKDSEVVECAGDVWARVVVTPSPDP